MMTATIRPDQFIAAWAAVSSDTCYWINCDSDDGNCNVTLQFGRDRDAEQIEVKLQRLEQAIDAIRRNLAASGADTSRVAA